MLLSLPGKPVRIRAIGTGEFHMLDMQSPRIAHLMHWRQHLRLYLKGSHLTFVVVVAVRLRSSSPTQNHDLWLFVVIMYHRHQEVAQEHVEPVPQLEVRVSVRCNGDGAEGCPLALIDGDGPLA